MKAHFDWFQSPTGQRVIAEETRRLEPHFESIFGHWLVQLGAWGHLHHIHAASRTRQQRVIAGARTPAADVVSRPNALALMSDNIDAIIIAHAHEYYGAAVLTEAERCLVGEGRVFILGFNPYSHWLNRRPKNTLKDAPKAVGKGCLKRQLAQAGLEVVSVERTLYTASRIEGTNRFLQRLVHGMIRYLCPILAGGYLIVARKRVTTVTPIKPRKQYWHKTRAKGLIHPTTRTPKQ